MPKGFRPEPRQSNEGTGFSSSREMRVGAGRTIGAEPIFIGEPGAEVTPGGMGIDPGLVETSD